MAGIIDNAEIIPIDHEAALNKEPIHIQVTPEAFPEEFLIRLDWNVVTEHYTFEVIHNTIDERVIKNHVDPYFPYWYDPYILFMFVDRSGRRTDVKPETLGDEIKLYVWPGPAGREG